MVEINGKIFRRSFPIGYLFHPDPFDTTSNSDSIIDLFLILFSIYSQRKSYLVVKNEGLEIYWRKDNFIIIGWDKVLRLERKRRYGVLLDMLYFDLDKSIFKKNDKLLFLTEGIKKKYYEIENKNYYCIPLQAYQGWANGQLMEELNKHIPEIFSYQK
jgi:hypothetical protein